jgi:hypothetical protein
VKKGVRVQSPTSLLWLQVNSSFVIKGNENPISILERALLVFSHTRQPYIAFAVKRIIQYLKHTLTFGFHRNKPKLHQQCAY